MTDKKFNGDMVILRGIPGSGKSTLCSMLRGLYPEYSIKVVSADHYMVDDEGNYKFDFKKLESAHTQCFQAAMESEADIIIVDNTNTQRWELSPYLSLGRAQGRKVSLMKMKVTSDEAAARNIHGVPAASIEKMQARFESVLPFWPHECVTSSPTEDVVKEWADFHFSCVRDDK